MSDHLVWPAATPPKVILAFRRDVSGRMMRANKEYSFDEVNAAANRLLAMGVDEVYFDLDAENGAGVYHEKIPFIW